MWRVLLTKNLALLVIVGVPTLVATAVFTLRNEAASRLMITLPGVALPMLMWLGVGNVVSVLLPVQVRSLRQRWALRRQLRSGVRWLVHLALPYGLLYVVEPLGGAPRALLRSLGGGSVTTGLRGLVLLLTGLVIWLLGTLIASAIVRRRGLQVR